MAAIQFTCDACQHPVVADALASGSEIRCPGCQKPLIVPNPPTLDAAANADELPPVSQAGPAPASQPAADLPQIEGYEILAKLGEGGMGAVYRARQPLLNRVVALKVMARRYSDDPSFVARFVREAAAAANLSHRNMVQVFTAGESNGIRFIAMEFVEGRTLSEHIRKHGRLDAREAVAVAIYVAQALQYAWNKARLIHRDIKPENVFLSYGGEVKVGDLGLAKSVGETETVLTTTGVTVGSPHYISPEQARAAKDMDFRADIYSLGCTLFHMLTGRPPFDAEDILSIMMKHVSEPPPVISEIWPECPPSLAALLGRMLAKDRNARPASYEKLVEELVVIHDELRSSSKPSPISPVEPTKSFVAKTVPALRRKPPVMIGTAVAVAAGVITFAGLWLWSSWEKPESADISPVSSVASDPQGGQDAHSPGVAPATPATTATTISQPWTNSLGMKFVPVAGTSVQFSIWDARVQDYQAFVTATGRSWGKPPFEQGPTHPAVNVSWDDAKAFCAWLTGKERCADALNSTQEYRLPTDMEWSAAVGLENEIGSTPAERSGKIADVFPWGAQWPPPRGAGNYGWKSNVDDFAQTSPVGSFAANRFGLYDMGGNVFQWCEDFYDGRSGDRMLRGASWFHGDRGHLSSSSRNRKNPDYRNKYHGFRCVLAGGGVSAR
ncbi:MAG: bifunctional serine/threonine-protein kinase/formylglycine-generating enzyme family protein [Verrucomicrobia bacterium]|nr:bifunctional serine/threonine-protein kinase/formylglycine-generating enzyme family protein [Verrucomicrobiota bacterium]